MKFCNKIGFTCRNDPENLDPSYQTDLDLCNYFRRIKTDLITEEIRYAFFHITSSHSADITSSLSKENVNSNR